MRAADVVAAIRAGRLAVIPTDTVYGLVCSADAPEPVRALVELKRRPPDQPVALMATSVDVLLESIPGLDRRSVAVACALLPGPFTLVLANPARRFTWLAGPRRDALGVRVPDLVGEARAVLDSIPLLAATSANLHGEPDPRRVEDLAPAIREAAVVLDGGELPGTPSTIVDLTGADPRVVRDGIVPASQALARVREALAG
jgi:L-threonylcarbamoyladenylate synthase